MFFILRGGNKVVWGLWRIFNMDDVICGYVVDVFKRFMEGFRGL